MPRPRVTEESRRRVAKACTACQEGKHKCDGHSPCAKCTARNRASECLYSNIERSYGARRRRRRSTPRSHGQLSSPVTTPSQGALSESGKRQGLDNAQVNDQQPAAREANRQKTLYDTRGRVGRTPTFLHPPPWIVS